MPEALFRADPPPPMPLFDVHLCVAVPGLLVDQTGSRLTFESLSELELAGGCVTTGPALNETTDISRRARHQADYANETLRERCEESEKWLALAYLGDASLSQSRMKPGQYDTLDGFAGVKMVPPVGGIPTRKALSDISERHLPVLVYGGMNCSPESVERDLLPHLAGPVILAHLGSFPCAAELLEQAVDLAQRVERVYLETSAAAIGNFITYAAKRVPEKVLFGSNSPMCPPSVQWGHVAASVRDDATLERIAYRNAEGVFGVQIGVAK